ncbi:MAG: HEAT repeat domain-containing protein, partial [Bacteroidales bacterium]
MKILKPIFICFSILCLSIGSFAQDKRTIETKVADLLAQLPASNSEYTDKLMANMFAIGEPGLKMICSLIIPAGTGDDTRSRFAVESLSRFLSGKGNENEKASWEKICIDYAVNQKDNGVKDFFMKQLQLIGSDATVSALKGYLSNKEICGPALAAIQACGGKAAEAALAESLKDTSLPCAAAVMNALAGMRSQVAVPEYIAWASDINANTRASALNALAQSGNPLAYPVLSKAAKDVEYRWEPTGATSALLSYATNAGKSGDLKTMDRICKVVMSKCRDKLTMQNKARALKIYAGFHGRDAAKELLKAAEYPDKTYRDAAFQASLAIPGEEILADWIKYFPGATADAKPEIIRMLGT